VTRGAGVRAPPGGLLEGAWDCSLSGQSATDRCVEVQNRRAERECRKSPPPGRVGTRERPSVQSVVRQQSKRSPARPRVPAALVMRDGDAARGDAARDDFAHV
jgi:hypothetical protein